MKGKESRGFFYWLVHKPLLFSGLIRSHKITPEEKAQVMSSLAVHQANHATFLGWFLTLLSIAYMVMFYGFHMHPDDEFYSVIAMFLLFASSLLYSGIMTVVFFRKKDNPLASRLALDAYLLLLLSVMGLYIYAATLNTANDDAFCPSFLYLLVFALLASPYFLDAMISMVGGLLIVLLISALGGVGIGVLLQYGLIGMILLSGMVYLSSFNFLSEVKTIRLNEANDELAFLSTHDPLTGINNRHSLHTFLAENMPLFLQKGSRVAFVMMDVDSFKSYNDHLSHMEGDECLKKVVNSINSAHLFPEDCFYRFGGDEFLIVLPEATPEEVKRIGEGIVQAVYGAGLSSAPDAPFPFVSLSAGASLSPIVPEKNLDDYLAEADKQLYLAKAAGHNRFFFLDSEIYCGKRK
jgi:diguanylate cyclase (GGDEF)-like protein